MLPRANRINGVEPADWIIRRNKILQLNIKLVCGLVMLKLRLRERVSVKMCRISSLIADDLEHRPPATAQF